MLDELNYNETKPNMNGFFADADDQVSLDPFELSQPTNARLLLSYNNITNLLYRAAQSKSQSELDLT